MIQKITKSFNKKLFEPDQNENIKTRKGNKNGKNIFIIEMFFYLSENLSELQKQKWNENEKKKKKKW